jgi:uncharacterized protein (DUF1778 family)
MATQSSIERRQFNLRTTTEEMECWHAEASARGTNISDFVRQAMRAAIANTSVGVSTLDC